MKKEKKFPKEKANPKKTHDHNNMEKNLRKYCVSINIARELSEIGYDEPCLFGYDSMGYIRAKISLTSLGCKISWDKHDNHLKAPLYQEVFEWFRRKHGLYVVNQPEFYTTGINFNWQILWYLPKEEWKFDEKNSPFLIETGTGMYGDNAEYPSQEEADAGMIEKMIEIVKERKNEKTKQ